MAARRPWARPTDPERPGAADGPVRLEPRPGGQARARRRAVGQVRAFELPADSPLPKVCPECGAAWMGHGSTADPNAVFLVCSKWHRYDQTLAAEEALAHELAVKPEELLSLPIWVVGDDHPLSDDPRHRVSPRIARGSGVAINGREFVVESVGLDCVWVRPVEPPRSNP